jgi:hypothetical protein
VNDRWLLSSDRLPDHQLQMMQELVEGNGSRLLPYASLHFHTRD